MKSTAQADVMAENKMIVQKERIVEDMDDIMLSTRSAEEESAPIFNDSEPATISLDVRSEVLQNNKFSRHAAFSFLSKDELRVITQGADQKRMFWASYELAIRFPEERSYLESLLRVNHTMTKEKQILMVKK